MPRHLYVYVGSLLQTFGQRRTGIPRVEWEIARRLIAGGAIPFAFDERAGCFARLKDGVFGRALGAAGIAGFSGLTRLYTAGPEELRRFVGEGPVLTDDRPLVEYFLSLPPDEPVVDLRSLSGDVNRHIVP